MRRRRSRDRRGMGNSVGYKSHMCTLYYKEYNGKRESSSCLVERTEALSVKRKRETSKTSKRKAAMKASGSALRNGPYSSRCQVSRMSRSEQDVTPD